MPHIQALESHVAELIAAGEVVERPASVVKELVENSIDAGASAVSVEIRRGGIGMIRVTDNGCGIAPEELPTAFLRHATSKLREASDLAGIGTLGFRGEALAAICAVSRVEIQTRESGAVSGAELQLEGGVHGEVTEIGAPEGTTIIVRDLFYNTPARLKFMRKDSSEAAAIGGLIQHLALSHPEISFQFIRDGVEVMHTPGDGNLLSAIYAALGREFAVALVPVDGRGGEITVNGFVTSPAHGRGSRSMQVFFVNGRFIKSPLMTTAVEEAYRNQLLKGKFPGCVLSVGMPVTAVDVNVHPAKTQVKFAREKDVFQAVYHIVRDALAERGGPMVRTAPGRSEFPAVSRGEFSRKPDAKPYRKPGTDGILRAVWNADGSVGLSGGGNRAAPMEPPRPVKREDTKDPPAVPEESEPEKPPMIPAIPPGTSGVLPGQETFEPPEEPPWRIAGEVLNTYIVCETGGGDVCLIDKHAAHERVNFNRLQVLDEPPMRQTLLRPAAVELSREDTVLLLEHLEFLERLGFSCEDFGNGAILVRELPEGLDPEDAAPILEEFAEDLRTGRNAAERREAVLRTMACKASIKGGWESDSRELQVLVEKVQSGEIRYCPHGRPVAVTLTKHQIEKMFKRT